MASAMIIRDASLQRLLENIDNNKARYQRAKPWLADYFVENWSLPSSVDLPALIALKAPS